MSQASKHSQLFGWPWLISMVGGMPGLRLVCSHDASQYIIQTVLSAVWVIGRYFLDAVCALLCAR